MVEAQDTPTFVKIAEFWEKNSDPIPQALSYGDVLLLPGYSSIETLDDVSTETELVRGMPMHIPILSANMSSVTEAPMAEFMAKVGGIGIIHRAMTIEEEVAQVRHVKDATNFIVTDPPKLTTDDTVEKARVLMEERQRGFVLVVGKEGQLEGIASTRDLRERAQHDAPLSRVMTPRERLVIAQPGISMEDAQQMMYERRIEKLPLLDENGNIGGVITDRDVRMLQRYPHATKDERGRLRVGAAIGIHNEARERAQALIDVGVDIIVIDVLHGDQKRVEDMVKYVKSLSPTVPVMAGNVATPDATERLIFAGVDSVKVGYGPGQMCTTQVETGTGSQQFSAIIKSAAIGYQYGIPINADGGVRSGGDVTKALAAGADHVMIGTNLAGTDESPGDIKVDDETGDMYKIVRGMASEEAQNDLANARGVKPKKRIPQGTTARVNYVGSSQRVIDRYVGGIISGIANTGSRSISELQMNATFERQTVAGQHEGSPHVRMSARRR